jgi:predicted nuclease of predicted toxin-antitoxin system
MTVKILADPFFPENVVQELSEAGYDAVHALEIGAADLPLREFLRLAAFESRVVVSRNRSLARLVESEASLAWPSVIFFRESAVESQHITATLFNLLKLFEEDLADGALVIVREGQTLLRKFTKP